MENMEALRTAIRGILAAKLGKPAPVQEQPLLRNKIDADLIKYHVRNAVDDLKRERGLR